MWPFRSARCGHWIHRNYHYLSLIKPIFLFRNPHTVKPARRLVCPRWVGLGSLACGQPCWLHCAFGLRPCVEPSTTWDILLAVAQCVCQIPRDFTQRTKFFLFILVKMSGKATEDGSWKFRWGLALVRAEATTKPSFITLFMSLTSNLHFFHFIL